MPAPCPWQSLLQFPRSCSHPSSACQSLLSCFTVLVPPREARCRYRKVTGRACIGLYGGVMCAVVYVAILALLIARS